MHASEQITRGSSRIQSRHDCSTIPLKVTFEDISIPDQYNAPRWQKTFYAVRDGVLVVGGSAHGQVAAEAVVQSDVGDEPLYWHTFLMFSAPSSLIETCQTYMLKCDTVEDWLEATKCQVQRGSLF